jgi:hypothetical protein
MLAVEREVLPVSSVDWQLARFRASREPMGLASGDVAESKRIDGVHPTRHKLAAADIKFLSAIVSQLVELQQGPERDEYGVLRPTKHAFEQAISLLVDTAIAEARRGGSIPHGCASTDAQGGVRIEWVGARCSLHLVVPASPSNRAYLYHEVGDGYGSTDALSPESLGEWLRTFQATEKGEA